MTDPTERPTDAEVEALADLLWESPPPRDERRIIREWLAPILAAEVERAVAARAGPLAEACREVQSALLSYRDRLAGMGCESWIDADGLLASIRAALAAFEARGEDAP